MLYGHQPRHFGWDHNTIIPLTEVEQWPTERKSMQRVIQQHLVRAQLRMKQQANKNRSERSFEVGDTVLLKLQPYVQTLLAPRSCQKLAFKYFGPHQVLEKIGKVAYKLALPASSTIHLVFHVSQLKKVQGNHPVIASLPDTNVQLQIPERILQRRLHRRADKVVL